MPFPLKELLAGPHARFFYGYAESLSLMNKNSLCPFQKMKAFSLSWNLSKPRRYTKSKNTVIYVLSSWYFKGVFFFFLNHEKAIEVACDSSFKSIPFKYKSSNIRQTSTSFLSLCFTAVSWVLQTLFSLKSLGTFKGQLIRPQGTKTRSIPI